MSFGVDMAGELILLLGGARSGKSSYALDWATQHAGRVLFVATAQAFDDEMRERIDRHRAERPEVWATLEAPLNAAAQIAAQLQHIQGSYDLVILDCITLLASNILLSLDETASQTEIDQAILQETDALLTAHAESHTTWLVVSNEVGMGVVPPSRLGRTYRDALGRANQRLASAADQVFLLVAGLPWQLK